MGGTAQVFWALPMARAWGKPWYYVGIGGTLVLIAIWVITRFPGNPITGRAGQINEMGIVVELLETAFVVLTAAIIIVESRAKRMAK